MKALSPETLDQLADRWSVVMNQVNRQIGRYPNELYIEHGHSDVGPWPALYALFTDESFSTEAVRRACEFASRANVRRRASLCTIVLDDLIIGYIGAAGCESTLRNGRWEVGYFLDPSYQGKGIVSRLAPVFFQNLRETLRVRGFFAFVKPGNTASEKILDRCGFVKAGSESNWTPLIFEDDESVRPDVNRKRFMNYFESIEANDPAGSGR